MLNEITSDADDSIMAVFNAFYSIDRGLEVEHFNKTIRLGTVSWVSNTTPDMRRSDLRVVKAFCHRKGHALIVGVEFTDGDKIRVNIGIHHGAGWYVREYPKRLATWSRLLGQKMRAEVVFCPGPLELAQIIIALSYPEACGASSGTSPAVVSVPAPWVSEWP